MNFKSLISAETIPFLKVLLSMSMISLDELLQALASSQRSRIRVISLKNLSDPSKFSVKNDQRIAFVSISVLFQVYKKKKEQQNLLNLQLN